MTEAVYPAGPAAPTIAIILSWERPLYLWACLDSFWRHTQSDVDFIIADSGSKDPQVREIIGAFNRRGMFRDVILNPENDPRLAHRTMDRLMPDMGEHFFFIESDVAVAPSRPCWAEIMLNTLKDNPRLAMLGSQIDRTDFIDPAAIGQPDLAADSPLGELIKLRTRERTLNIPAGTIASPFNPPGRFLALRTAAFADVPLCRDSVRARLLTDAGWQCAISGDVIHRHLSLQNYYDYPDYDIQGRANWMNATTTDQQRAAIRALKKKAPANG